MDRNLDKYNTAPTPFKAFLANEGKSQLERIVRPQQQQAEVRPLIDSPSRGGDIRRAQRSDEGQVTSPRIGGSEFNMQPLERQRQLLSKAGQITQRFGNRNPIERFSGGVNYGTDIAVPRGTKVALPEGQWQVMEAFDGAEGEGFIGNNTNRGYGNSVLVRNAQTGEMLRFSHLDRAAVQTGQMIAGGTVIGLSGSTGNSSGPHLDLEYYDQRGQLRDVLSSRYGGALAG